MEKALATRRAARTLPEFPEALIAHRRSPSRPRPTTCCAKTSKGETSLAKAVGRLTPLTRETAGIAC